MKIVSQENQGVSSTRNLGIENSSSDLIAFLDADDEWKPGFLKAILSLRKRYPDAGAYGTSYEILLRGGRVYHPKFGRIPYGWEGILSSYFRASFGLHVLHTSAVVIPKRIFEEVGGFPIGEKLGEDLDMWLRIALRFPIAYSNVEQSVYHQDAGNRTDVLPVSVDRLPYLKRAEQALRSGILPENIRDDLIEYVATRKIGYAIGFILKSNHKVGRKILEEIETKRFASRKKLWLMLSYIPTIFLGGLRSGKRYIVSFIDSGKKKLF
ncbi:MAG: glycosyltransferase family 2 protein [Desulfosarcina sp.]|nr:glycosyltransferase family 2 protein [Desulfosarcina sp.]